MLSASQAAQPGPEGAPEGGPQGGPDTAIILLTKNSQRYLTEILAAIAAQDTRRALELIAVDSGSTDDTLSILRAHRVRLFQIAPQEFNHGETRNFGARQASPSVRYLVYLTHDATPAPGWLDALIGAVSEGPMVAGAFSRHQPRPTCPLPMARLLAEEWEQSGTPDRVVKKISDYADYERRRVHYAWFSDSSSCLRREVWEAFPFARVDFGEDSEWADRVLRAGYTLIYEPASQIVHSHDYGLWDQFAQNVDHARGMKRVFGSAVYQDSPTLSTSLRLSLGTLARDARYIGQRRLPPWAKAYWLIYSPAWHLASHLGMRVGQNYERMPEWLVRRISKQERLRALGTGA